MNILPHKSWHVRTKKNIERVRRDEEKAAEEEKEKQRRIALAEQEARTDLLRSKARNRAITSPQSSSESLVAQATKGANSTSKDVVVPGLGDTKEHMNFFKEIEDGLIKQGKNQEHEAEKKKEQEDLEKRIGLLTYLGQTALESKDSAPWYLDKSLRKTAKVDDDDKEKKNDNEAELRRAVQKKRLEEMDPLLQMKQYVEKKKHSKHKKHKHKDKKRGQRDEKRQKSSSKPSSSSSSLPSSSRTPGSSATKKTIEELRAERIARERKEKLRTQALLSPGVGTVRSETTGLSSSGLYKSASNNSGDESSSDDSGRERDKRGIKRRYNSQYNPDFVRQPKSKPKFPYNTGFSRF
ncbi:leukocyte receptor cluster member 1 [Plakobranchus ocellatus]|uniref:Leukocyte receptor cluster member 1 n=1 Tax=Plakobranchus ocellatus TaxID=259542 RepID=A0AAV3ZYN2_9GAST|nr:leukocyte receptor cluster member 1 [Plakobranchus ocellatus]